MTRYNESIEPPKAAQLVVKGAKMYRAMILAVFLFSHVAIATAETNEIYSFNLLKQTNDSALFEVSYYYSGDHGDNAKLTAWPKPPGFWGSSIIPLVVGHHTSQLNVKLGPRVSEEVISDSIELFYYAEGGPPFYKKEFPFKKNWRNSLKKE